MKCHILILLFLGTCLQGKFQAFFPHENSLDLTHRHTGGYFSASITEDNTTSSTAPSFTNTENTLPENTLWNVVLGPNPAKDFIKVTVLAPVNNTWQVELLDLMGRRIDQKQMLLNQPVHFDLKGLSPSFYFIRISDPEKKVSTTRRISKERD